jgi:nitrogen fixation NifU-like protein
MDMYGELILEHYKKPQNKGTLEKPSVSHEEYNALCGDRVKIQLLIEKNKISDIRFEGKGCAISIAATSMLTDFVKGKTLEEIRKLDKADIMKMLGVEVNPARIKCALIGLKAVKLAVYEYMAKKDKHTRQEDYKTDE